MEGAEELIYKLKLEKIKLINYIKKDAISITGFCPKTFKLEKLNEAKNIIKRRVKKIKNVFSKMSKECFYD